jgi:hypothetical protein
MTADIAWDDIATAFPDVMKANTGGLVKSSDGMLTAFIGTDPQFVQL